MKKTLIALVVTAMAAASANAVVVYKNEGTKVRYYVAVAQSPKID